MRRKHTGSRLILGCAVLFATAALFCAQAPYGAGMHGTAAYPPALSTNGPWMGNYNHALTVHGALPFTYGAFAVSFAPDVSSGPLLVDLGAALYAFVPATTDAFGSTALPLGLGFPAVPSFAGLPFFAQFGCVDPGSTLGIALSPGLACQLAMPPLVFYGTSVAGANDPWWILDPYSATYAPVAGGTSGMNNVKSAAWVNGGRELWVACLFAPFLQWLDMTTSPPTVHVVPTATASVQAVHLDRTRGILYTLSETSDSVAAYDVTAGSASYGNQLGLNTPAGVAMYMSSAIGKGGTRIWQATALQPYLAEFDTNPASATWLTNINIINVPYGPNMATVQSLSVTDQGSGQLLCTIQGFGQVQGEVARRNLATGQWIDHNPTAPGIQNIGPSSSPAASPGIAPARVDIASDGRNAAVGSVGGGTISTTPGSLSVVQLDPASPSFWTMTQLPLGALANNCWTASFLPDNQTIAFASWAPSRALVVDLAGTIHQNRTLSGATTVTLTNIYTCVAR